VPRHGVVTHLPYGYDHPPGSTVVDAPLGLLSLSLAEDLIVIVSGLAGMLAIALVCAGRKEISPWRVALAALIVSISRPFHEELTLGNIELLALAPMVLGLVALERGRERIGGVLMGLGVCIKPTAALVLLALVATAIGFAVVPHSGRFFSSVIPFLTGPEQGKADFNGSFTGIVESLGLGSSTPATVTQAFALVTFVGLWWRYRWILARSLELSMALLVIATLIIPRYSFEVYGLYLVLAFPVVLRARGKLEIALAAIAVWFLTVRDVLPLGGSAVERFRELRPGMGRIALAVMLVVMLERLRREAPASARFRSKDLRSSARSMPTVEPRPQSG
jgi:hypothetical protein